MSGSPMRLGVLASGRGSNLEAILRAGLEVVIVISNRLDVPALEIARDHGTPTRVLRRVDFPNLEARDAAIGAALAAARVELAVLAGYDQRLRPGYFAAFAGRTINIHPSLLPAHGGPGMLGEAVHRSVLDAGDRETGATVHEVNADLDAGPILAQVRVPVIEGDDPMTLAARVLAAEHRLLVAVIRDAAERSATSPAAVPSRRR